MYMSLQVYIILMEKQFMRSLIIHRRMKGIDVGLLEGFVNQN
jgi:hypothetical protein